MKCRPFDGEEDYERVSAFLRGLFLPDNRDGNWLQPVWEYAYTHPWFDETSVDRIGVWESNGRIVGLATYELRLGEAFFPLVPGWGQLKTALLTHAEVNLFGTDDRGRRFLQVYVNESDDSFREIVSSRGFERSGGFDRTMSQFRMSDPFPAIDLPEGFRLQSLADENDLHKVNRVLHRGFNHSGEPPPDGVAGRRKMQSGPNYRRDLTIVAVGPDGEYVSYCGMWHDAANRLGYVEPVATDPEYRRRGLGTAVVLEAIRRCAALGAAAAYVGSDKPFYLAMGFRPLYTAQCWAKVLD